MKQSLLAQQCKRKACLWIRACCLRTYDEVSVGLETVRERRACVSGNCERTTRVYTVDDEDIRSLGLVNDRLRMDYTPRCRCGVQADR
jgi:hypothetical protein